MRQIIEGKSSVLEMEAARSSQFHHSKASLSGSFPAFPDSLTEKISKNLAGLLADAGAHLRLLELELHPESSNFETRGPEKSDGLTSAESSPVFPS